MTFWNVFLVFSRKQNLTLHANCLLKRQFAWSVRSNFQGKTRKISSVCRLLNLPIAWYESAGLPLIFYFKIHWLFPDFSLTFHHFPDISDNLPTPLTATKYSNRALTFRELNNHLTKEWGQFYKFMFLKIKRDCHNYLSFQKILKFPDFLSFFYLFFFSISLIQTKFPDFSLTWKNFHFPDFFLWPWQSCKCL